MRGVLDQVYCHGPPHIQNMRVTPPTQPQDGSKDTKRQPSSGNAELASLPLELSTEGQFEKEIDFWPTDHAEA